jgi:hypothetical protein
MSDYSSEEAPEQRYVCREQHKSATKPDAIDPCASCSGYWNRVDIV